MLDINPIDLLKQPITITDEARQEIKRLMSADERDELYLRFGVEAGGCSGMSYTMDFVDNKTDNDRIFVTGEISVVVDRGSMPYLSGLTLSFKNALVGGGFKFSNPNAKRSCGCGTSFKPME